MLWDEGYWQPDGNVDEGLSKGALKFLLHGVRLKGKWTLIRWEAKSSEHKKNWILLKEKDEFVKSIDVVSEYTTSIRTGRTMDEIKAEEEEKIVKNPFYQVTAQLAKLVNEVPKSEDWLYELKYDGYRILAFVEENNVRLLTRNNNDYTKYFQSIASSLVTWAAGRAMVLDGEVVVTDEEGKSDFNALQNYVKNAQNKSLTYIVFDLLALDGVDIREKPLLDRKKMLEHLMEDAPQKLYYSRYVIGRGQESFSVSCEQRMEGIVGKKVNSPYSGGRNGDWIKLKCDKRQEFIIGGYSISDKKTSGVSSLLLGIYEGGKLVYVGRAGTGISRTDEKALRKEFENIQRLDCPFESQLKLKSNEDITWLKPELIAEIKFNEWTKDNLLRHASYKGLRRDKDPKDVVREKINEEEVDFSTVHEVKKITETDEKHTIEGVKISSPDKVIYEDLGISKEDVIKYYKDVSRLMLTYINRRILSVVRCPKGISNTCFFMKHPSSSNKGVKTISIANSRGERKDYFYIEDVTGLISEVQMGTLEFHTWGSRIEELEKPDIMVFDLDPDEGMDLQHVRQGVRDIKDILNELNLNSFLKTSGGKGYHVVVPLKPSANWESVSAFSRSVVEVMEKKWPDRYTSNVRKSKRKDKIFIDWIRNGRGATSIAPYSLRARKGAKVSMPISWDELDTVAPDSINMEEAVLRLGKGDPWEGFVQSNQMLKDL